MKRLMLLIAFTSACAADMSGAALFDTELGSRDGGTDARGSPINAQGGGGKRTEPGDAHTDTYIPPTPLPDAPKTPPMGEGGSDGRPEGGNDAGGAGMRTAGAGGTGGSPPSGGGNGGSGPTAGAGGQTTIDVWSPPPPPADAGTAPIDSGPTCVPKCPSQSVFPCGVMDDGCGHPINCGDNCNKYNPTWACGGGGPNTCGDCRNGYPPDWAGDKSCGHPYMCPHADFPYMSAACSLIVSSSPGNFSLYCCPG